MWFRFLRCVDLRWRLCWCRSGQLQIAFAVGCDHFARGLRQGFDGCGLAAVFQAQHAEGEERVGVVERDYRADGVVELAFSHLDGGEDEYGAFQIDVDVVVQGKDVVRLRFGVHAVSAEPAVDAIPAAVRARSR